MKKYKFLGIASVFILTGLLGLGLSNFHSVSATEDNNFPPLVQRLVERFGLNTDEVSEELAVFAQEREQERHQHLASSLDEMVESGEITEDQKILILEKRQEIFSRMEESRDLEPEMRHEVVHEIHEQWRTWAEENGLDLPLSDQGPHGGLGMRGGQEMSMKGYRNG